MFIFLLKGLIYEKTECSLCRKNAFCATHIDKLIIKVYTIFSSENMISFLSNLMKKITD